MLATSWTDERVAEVSRMMSERMSASQIAAQMGVTRNAVIGIAHRRKLAFARWHGQHNLPNAQNPKKERRPYVRKTAIPPPLKLVDVDLRQADVEPRHITLLELTEDDCKYPFGDGPFTFCALPIYDGCYCAGHFMLTRNFAPRGRERRRRYSKYGTLLRLEVVV